MIKHTFIALFTFFLSVNPVLAASPTPRPSSSPSSSPTPTTQETTQKLKERIERVVEEKREQIKGVLTELSKKKKGYVGEVQRVLENSLTVKTRKATHIIPLAGEVTITRLNKPVALSDVAVGDWAIVIGGLKDDEFQPERLIISSTSLLPPPQVVTIGTIDEIARTKIAITPRSTPEKKEFVITKNTVYQDNNGNALKVTQLSTDIQALIVAQETDTGAELKVVRLLAPLTETSDDN